MAKNSAIVFNCHYNGLAIIRELGRKKIPVVALDKSRTVGTFSRFSDYRCCPDPQIAEDAFIDFLLKMGPKFTEKPVLFPTNDHWAVSVSRHKTELEEYFILGVPDYETVSLIIKKQRFYDWALARKYPVPRSWNSFDIEKIPADVFPIVAKPEYRRTASNNLESDYRAKILDKMRLTIIRNRNELTDFITTNHNIITNFLFQEYIEGLSDRMYTVGIYANRKYDVLAMFTGRKVRGFPPDYGDCVVGQVENVPEELKSLVKNICKEIKYSGIAEFEFKKDARTNEFKLIEINPRSWSWVGITPACNVSLPWIAYCDLVGEKTASYIESNLPDGSVVWLKCIDDIINCHFKNKRSGYPQWHMSPIQWIKSFLGKKVVIAEFSIDDPLPFLHSILITFYSSIKHFFRKHKG